MVFGDYAWQRLKQVQTIQINIALESGTPRRWFRELMLANVSKMLEPFE